MSGRYILIRALGDEDERAAVQWRVGEHVRTGEGSFSMTLFELPEDESPVVIAKRLIHSYQVEGVK